MSSATRPSFRASSLAIVLILGVALFLGGCTKEKPAARVVDAPSGANAELSATPVVTVPTAELGGELLPTLTPTLPATTIATQPTATAESSFSELTGSSAEATATVGFTSPMTGTEPLATPVPVLTAMPEGIPTPFTGGMEPSTETQPVLTEMPTQEPAPYAAPQPPATAYVVRWGDTLYSIAVEFGVTVEEIMAVNGLQNDLIVVGQELTVPGGGTGMAPVAGSESVHVVQPGETLFSIGVDCNASWQAIAQANGITNPWFIYVGQKLVIPGGGIGVGQPAPASTYVVQPGDTLYTIAMRFDTTVQSLMVTNNLGNPNMIYVGQVLSIQ